MNDCPQPKLVGSTNGALAQLAVDQRDSLRGCNLDKAALRSWADQVTAKVKKPK